MRTLQTSLVLFGLAFSSTSWAQDVDPAEAAPDTGADPAAEPAEEPLAEEPLEEEPLEEEVEAAAGGEAGASVGGGASAGAAVGGAAAPPPVVQLNPQANAAVPVVDVSGGGGGNSAAARNYGGPTTDADSEWKLSWSGYFRAPMRIGIGDRNEEFGTRRPPEVGPGYPDQSGVTLSAPLIPDDQYLSWQYTRNGEKSWAELFMHYGNSWAEGTLALQGFNFTDAGYNDQEAQFGFGLGYVTLRPDVSWVYDGLNLLVRAGVFWGRYGAAGKYDAGQYDTYLMGRTHHAGILYRASVQLEEMELWLEQGFGTKQANPNIWNFDLFTLLHHIHAGVKWAGPIQLDFALHWMRAWTQEPVHACHANFTPPADYEYGTAPADLDRSACQLSRAQVAALGFTVEPPDGRMDVFGADVTADLGGLGRLYTGASLINASAAESVGPAIEVVHAFGGGFFNSGITGQYFTGNDTVAYPPGSGGWAIREVTLNRGYGNILNILFQHDISLSSLIGADVFGEQALDFSSFFMLNFIDVDEAAVVQAHNNMGYTFDPNVLLGVDNIIKFKVGGELTYAPVKWMNAQFRFDHVRPNNYNGPVSFNGMTQDAAGNPITADMTLQTFSVFSPRLTFKSNFATHEQLTLAYGYYLYANKYCTENNDPRECAQRPTGVVAPDGFGNLLYSPGSTPETGRGSPSHTGESRPAVTGGDVPLRYNNSQIPHEHVVRVFVSIWF